MNFISKSLIVLSTFSTITGISQNNTQLIGAYNESYNYEATAKYELAISSITKIYSATSYEANLRLGWLNYLAGKYKDAISYYHKASLLMPAATEPMWAIINPYTALENWVEIEKTYLSILKLDSKNTTANYNIGLIYYYRKDYVKAKKHFDISLNLAPFGYNNMLMSAWTNYFLGNKNEATILFNKVLLYSPNDKSALEGLSLIK